MKVPRLPSNLGLATLAASAQKPGKETFRERSCRLYNHTLELFSHLEPGAKL